MDDTGPPFHDAIFEIPHRPTRITHDEYCVTDETGTPVMDEGGDPVTAGGGFTIEGYTTFNLRSAQYDRDAVDEAITRAEQWGPYLISTWEPYNHLLYDTDACCPVEVRVLPERLAIDVKASTTSDCVQQFVESVIDHVGPEIEWEIDRQSERLAA